MPVYSVNLKDTDIENTFFRFINYLSREQTIYPFDECVANQDPQFSEYFYYVHLLDLNIREKCVMQQLMTNIILNMQIK